MADIAREMEDFKAANRTFGGERKLETKGSEQNCSSNQPSSCRSSASNCSSNQPSSCRSSAPDPPLQPICLSTPSACKNIDKYSKSYYNYNNSNVTWGGSDSELKRQRRVLKYKSYAVETKLKSSFMNGFRWMKNKYCQFVHGC